MITNLLYIFLPLVAGYCLSVSNNDTIQRLRHFSVWIVYSILLLLGLTLSAHQNLLGNLRQIAGITACFFILISLANIAMLALFDKTTPSQPTMSRRRPTLLPLVAASCQPILIVVTGIMTGLGMSALDMSVTLPLLDAMMKWTLFVLLFLIGIELKNSGLPLREMVLNPAGLKIAMAILMTSWAGGLLAGWLTDLPWLTSLTLASGFGWYSLSGILVSDAYGPVLGTSSFMIELLRELMAIALIPILIPHKPCTAIGYAGATAMDFTLPMIQKNGGIQCVPIAIVSGFVLSACVPIFMSLFISIAL